MTELTDVTPQNQTPAPAAKPAARVRPQVKQEDDTVWIRLVRGGRYAYKRAIYEEGNVYEVDQETADHLLAQYFEAVAGDEIMDVHYFEAVPKKKGV